MDPDLLNINVPSENTVIERNANDLTYHLDNCNVCVAYQCLDWNVGSAGMQARAAEYLARTGEDVVFGVGQRSNTADEAGKCYRIALNSTDVNGQLSSFLL